jgi:hypothetical protein
MNAATDNSRNWRGLLGRLGAEFAVVVLGVTIALWADGWVADRRDRAVEVARLVALQDNVSGTLAKLREASDNAAEAAAALRELVSLQQHDLHDDDVLKLLLSGLFYGSTFYPELNVYDDLKSSGELALLTNPVLRRSLATMDARLEQVQLVLADLATVQQLNMDSYLINRLDLLPLLGPYTGLDNIAQDTGLDLGFTSDLEFRNLVLFKFDLLTGLKRDFKKAEAALTAVQRSIESQLR